MNEMEITDIKRIALGENGPYGFRVNLEIRGRAVCVEVSADQLLKYDSFQEEVLDQTGEFFSFGNAECDDLGAARGNWLRKIRELFLVEECREGSCNS